MEKSNALDKDFERYDTFVLPDDAAAITDTEDDAEPITTTETDGKRQLIGYAVVWGAISNIRRAGKRHRFAKGSIQWNTPTAALWHHDFATPLASTANGTLSIVEDDYGAKATITLDSTTDGDNAFTRVKDRLVAGMSFGGIPLRMTQSEIADVLDVNAFAAPEISLTISPAMQETNIVPANQSDELDKQKSAAAKQKQIKTMQQTLDRSKLTLLTGRVSGMRVTTRK